MKARCVKCNKMWNLSWKQIIPTKGYECPRCWNKRKSDFGSKLSETILAQNKRIPARTQLKNKLNLTIPKLKGDSNIWR